MVSHARQGAEFLKIKGKHNDLALKLSASAARNTNTTHNQQKSVISRIIESKSEDL
jgi:autonomous glycyl radical cofactor GrcA